jgi:hypothetical protein
VNFFRLLLLFLIALCINAQASVLTKEEFLAQAQKLAVRNETKDITQAENSGCNGIHVIPKDDGKPFAVLKYGQRRLAEPFIYTYAEEVGLTNVVVPSFYVPMQLRQVVGDCQSIEAFVPVIPQGHNRATIPADILAFIEKYQDKQGALSLIRFNQLCKFEEDRFILFNNLSKESVDKAFVVYVLMHLADMNTRNTLVTLNAHNQFEVRLTDTESCFVHDPRYQTCVLGLPQAGQPMSDSVRALIPSIVAKMPSFEGRIQSLRGSNKSREDMGGFEQQYQRMQALDVFLKHFPQASPRALLTFAFWNCFTYPHSEPKNIACNSLDALVYGGLGYYGLEKRPAFQERVYSCFSYGYSSISSGINRYHSQHSGQLKSFTDMLRVLTTLKENDKKVTVTDVLSLVDPHVLEIESYPLGSSGKQPPFVWAKGFSEEGNNVWTNGKKATIEVPLMQARGRVKSIILKNTHAHISAQYKQLLGVSVNGEQVAEYQYTQATPSHYVELHFSLSLTGTAKVKFSMPYACRPGKLDASNLDPRKLAIAFNTAEVMFYQLHEPSQALLLNDTNTDVFQLGEGDGVAFPFPVQGFSAPQMDHRWTESKKVTMHIPLMQANGRVKSLVLKDTSAFLQDGHEQTVDVAVNGAPIETYHYTSATPKHNIVVPIPAGLTGEAEITFDIPTARKAPGDSRDLGFAAHMVEVKYYTIKH